MTFYPVYFVWHIIIATVFIIGAYSLAVGIKAKQRSFLYYTAYSFLLFSYLVLKNPYNGETFDGIGWLIFYWGVQVIYNLVYFLFFISFLDVGNQFPVFARRLKRFILIVFTASLIMAVFSIGMGAPMLFKNYFTFIFTPIATAAALIVLYKTFSIPGNLKYFFIVGSTSYLTMALLALIWSMNATNFNVTSWLVPLIFFYFGIFVEQLAFGLGISYRIHLISEKLIEASQKNERIKNEMNQKLNQRLREKEEALLKLTKAAEEKRIQELENKFEHKIHEIQLSSLQSKMNPHFIFNALNSIKVYLIENDKEMAVKYMNQFSKLIRKILEGSRVESFTLREEFEILELYISIENNRFEDNIDFTIPPLEGPLASIKVPPLVLQPFVENAIWHGLVPSPHSKEINFSFSTDANDNLVLSITDNGVGRENANKKKARKSFKKRSMGLKITRERIDHFNSKHGKNYGFQIVDLKTEDGHPAGTRVDFCLGKETQTRTNPKP